MQIFVTSCLNKIYNVITFHVNAHYSKVPNELHGHMYAYRYVETNLNALKPKWNFKRFKSVEKKRIKLKSNDMKKVHRVNLGKWSRL